MDGFQELTAVDLAGMGHNSSDGLAALQQDIEFALYPLRSRLAALREGIERLPAGIATRLAAENVTDALRMVAALRQTVEERRKEAKAPHLAAGKVVDSLFASLAEDAKALESALSPRLLAWLDVQPRPDNGKVRVRTQLGAVASLGAGEKVSVESREAVDLEALRPFLDFEAIKQAARAFHAAHKTAPAGVRVEPVRRLIIR